MKIPVILMGAGLIGQQFVRMLADHPYFELVAIVASEKSKGQLLKDRWILPSFDVPECFQSFQLTTFSDLDYDSFKVAFSALPADQAKDIELMMAQKGKKVFSNSSAYRYEPNVPILIPEVNAAHLTVVKGQKSYKTNKGFIITNSNCSISGLAILLHVINTSIPIKTVFVSTYQALSGGGLKTINETPRDRVIPYIQREEEKMSIEAKKILGKTGNGELIANSEFTLFANCARVPIIDGHLEAVTLELSKTTTEDKIKEIIADFSANLGSLPSAPEKVIQLLEQPDRPQSTEDLYTGTNKERAKGQVVSVGRIRVDGNYVRCFLLVHNTIRGGAGGSIINAELAYTQGYLD